MKKPQIPKYRKQKRANGRHTAFAQIDGKRYRLGTYDSQESWTKYHRLIAEWAEAGYKTPFKVDDDVTVAELVARFWEHAKQHYRRQDGTLTSEISNYRICIRDLLSKIICRSSIHGIICAKQRKLTFFERMTYESHIIL